MSFVALGVSGTVALASGVASTGLGIAGSIKGGKEKKRIRREAANMKETPLTNIADELKVSTVGAKLRQEGQSALEATQTASLQEAGTRAIGVGAGRVAAGSQAVNRDIAVGLEEQQQNIDQVRAQDSQRIQMTKEQRQQAKLAALSSQYNAANVQQQQGMANAVSGLGMAASSFGGTSATKGKNTGQLSSDKYKIPSSFKG